MSRVKIETGLEIARRVYVSDMYRPAFDNECKEGTAQIRAMQDATVAFRAQFPDFTPQEIANKARIALSRVQREHQTFVDNSN